MRVDVDCDLDVAPRLRRLGKPSPQIGLEIDLALGLDEDPEAVAAADQRQRRLGRALVQTYQPDHPVMAALLSGDAERFYAEETRAREMAGLPPFGRLAALIVSATDRHAAEAHARAIALEARPPEGVMVLGPAEAPLALIRGRYRFRLLVKTEREVDLQAYLRTWLARAPKTRGNVKVAIDVDPQSFL